MKTVPLKINSMNAADGSRIRANPFTCKWMNRDGCVPVPIWTVWECVRSMNTGLLDADHISAASTQHTKASLRIISTFCLTGEPADRKITSPVRIPHISLIDNERLRYGIIFSQEDSLWDSLIFWSHISTRYFLCCSKLNACSSTRSSASFELKSLRPTFVTRSSSISL